MAEAMVKEGQIDNARAMYQELIAKYPDTTFAAKARQRLKEL
jgi:TolA-binding protein